MANPRGNPPADKALQQQLNQINRFFEPFLSNFAFGDEDLVSGSWIPPVDVAEEADRILVAAELPGVNPEDIEIQFSDGVLTLRGERKLEKGETQRNYHRIERSYGTFVRSFTLPRIVDPEKISADYRDGILHISVPKRDESRPRQIKINIDASK